MTRSRQTNRDSVHGSESSEEDSDEGPRGRTGKSDAATTEEQVDAQIEAMMDANSKASGA